MTHLDESMTRTTLPPGEHGPRGAGGCAWRALDDACFEITGYDQQAPFSSFLPGIAEVDGAPLWCMYVNRGQAVCSFGYQDKDHAIGEFFSATWAYQLAGMYGFRTFVAEDGGLYEPFAGHSAFCGRGERTMRIQPHALSLVDEDHGAGWRTEVSYCTVVDGVVPALARRVRLTNVGHGRRVVRLADGLPVIVPAGVSDFSLKCQRRITESFIRVAPHECGGAVYRVPTTMEDEARIESVSEAVFYGAWRQGGTGPARALPLAVDPDAFFSPGGSLVVPANFLAGLFNHSDQAWMNKLPCAMALAEVDLAPGESFELVAYAGFAPNPELLNNFARRFSQADFDFDVELRAGTLVSKVTRPALARTASKELDGYLRQNYLDNVLRGGIPHMLPSRHGDRPVHVYTRRHGDLERDYNNFRVPAHPYSEGAGNFRDILQNRRHDAWFYPEAGAAEIVSFIALIQPDGYNPLSVEGNRWVMPDRETALSVCPLQGAGAREAFADMVTKPFTPGALLLYLAKQGFEPEDNRAWLAGVLCHAECHFHAVPDDSGYWIDHWIYLADMLEAHCSILPDGHAGLLDTAVGWFEPHRRVLPRRQRYQVESGVARQYGALGPREPGDRLEPWPKTSVASKLVALVAVKAMTLDPEGRGVEMEAGRPGWNDALNGLPGLFGSCTSETMAIARLCDHLLEHRGAWGVLELPGPAARLVPQVLALASADAYDWRAAADLREAYREAAYSESDVSMQVVDPGVAGELLEAARDLCRRGVDASRRPGSPLVHTYFMRDADGGAVVGGEACSIPARPLPLFLEGQVYRIRMARDTAEAREVYRALRGSPLYDRVLGTYMLNEDLTDYPTEIGRARTFTRGVYENESVWLHMSYKLLVELLRKGLYDEFHDEARTMLVPFMPPERYGRSIFENSSFIVSSNCPDTKLHGRGFVARLSGSTAEFVHIWLLLTVGRRPFTVQDGTLHFRLEPVLPSRWFLPGPAEVCWDGHTARIPAKSLACSFLGKTLLVYDNPGMKDTWGAEGAKVRGYVLDGEEYQGDTLCGDIARSIRAGEVERLDVLLE